MFDLTLSFDNGPEPQITPAVLDVLARRGLRTTFFVTVKNLTDRLYIADRSRGILPGPPRLVQTGLKFNF